MFNDPQIREADGATTEKKKRLFVKITKDKKIILTDESEKQFGNANSKQTRLEESFGISKEQGTSYLTMLSTS